MRKQDFDFHLPEELIAQFPSEVRDASRLMHLQSSQQRVTHRQFRDFPDCLRPGDCLVFNDTRVIPARLFVHKPSGGKVEIMLERVLDATSFLCQCRSSKPLQLGQVLHFGEQHEFLVEARVGSFWQLRSSEQAITLFEQYGAMPLPPYIKRQVDSEDQERYQTIYARQQGAVAAPTAGLHFTDAVFKALEAKGIERVFVTLHVAAGTFQSMRVDDISEHTMHSESYEITPESARRINQAKAEGRRVIAVGTTSVRVLESAALSGTCQPSQGETDIFIYPGYEFQLVDALLTNFHLPQSTLMMLVSAFAGREFILDAYQQATREKYRFFSYGDAMFIES